MITPGRIISGKNSRVVQKTNTTQQTQPTSNFTQSQNTNAPSQVGMGKIFEARTLSELSLISPTDFAFGFVRETKRLYYFANRWVPVNKVVQGALSDIVKSDYIVTNNSKFYNVDNISGTNNYIENREPYSLGIAIDISIKFTDDSNSFQLVFKNDTTSRIIRVTNYPGNTLIESQTEQIETIFDAPSGSFIRLRIFVDSSNMYITGYNETNSVLFQEVLANTVQVNRIRVYPKINGHVDTNYIVVNRVFSGMNQTDRMSFMLGNNTGFSTTPRRWL